MNNMNCPECNSTLRKVDVKVAGAKNKAVGYQCPKCDYFEFKPSSANKVVEELKATHLKIKHTIVKNS